jgi:thiamine-phosphate pyrophosphorylase
MEHNKVLKGLYPITPSLYKSDIDYLSQVKSVLESGVNVFQFRSKFLSFRRKRFLLKSISNICIDNNVKLIINDDYSLCKLFDISGLHIGRNDKDLISARKYFGKEFIIGKSCYNSIELAKYSMDNNASYVSFGAMYPTKSKASAIIVRHSILIEAKKIIRIPICVIGGINKSNVKQLIKYKPDMVSMISGIFNSKEIRKEIKDIKRIIIQ